MTIAEEIELYEAMADWIERRAEDGGEGLALVEAFHHLRDGSRPQARESFAEAKRRRPRG